MSEPKPWIAAEQGGEARKHAPATLRNREAIADVLTTHLPDRGTVLEIASGSGEHCAFFAERFPALNWQPSDPEPSARISIASWCAGLANVAQPLALDASSKDWPVDRADAVLCINMVHISPWQATLGLMEGAAQVLSPGAPLILYGPYRREGVETAPSNEAFDASLRSRDPRWGLRDLGAVTAAANEQGFALDEVIEMPANNLAVIYRR
ncbi:DUF938 domain-containing protein [Stakelama marina]|uniref:DUF938 domain-containing protein n=1 Tax=Stakelama marina TaxID=2826939 RepID=A0A8T4ICR3_9SPHN|nr:DUF938 domain-containing protein [Stakelama marina]MBR0552350.1 DUF938 domain-containing protein [Stakelama marina]